MTEETAILMNYLERLTDAQPRQLHPVVSSLRLICNFDYLIDNDQIIICLHILQGSVCAYASSRLIMSYIMTNSRHLQKRIVQHPATRHPISRLTSSNTLL